MFRSNLVTELFKFSNSFAYNLQQTRNTFILKRRTPMPLYKKGHGPRRVLQRYLIYDPVEDTNTRPHKPLGVILTQDVPGIGDKGEIIESKPHRIYKNYLLTGLAVYNTPQNFEKYECALKLKESDLASSPTVRNTKQLLSIFILHIIMNDKTPWVLEPWHISSAFYEQSIEVPDYAIEMPPDEIKGPDVELEKKEFYVTVVINKAEKVKVRCRILQVDSSGKAIIPLKPWDIYLEPLFPEQAKTLEKMPRTIH